MISLVAHRSHQRVITKIDSSSAPSSAFLAHCISLISKLIILWWLRLDQAFSSRCCHFREHVDQVLRILKEPPCPEIPFLRLQFILSVLHNCPFALLLCVRTQPLWCRMKIKRFCGRLPEDCNLLLLSLIPDISWNDSFFLLFLFHNISILQRRWHLSVF